MPDRDQTDPATLVADLHVQATYRLTEALVESENRMRRRIDLLSEIVFETDANGRFVFLNRAWTSILGYALQRSIGCEPAQFVFAEDRAICEAILRQIPFQGAEDRRRLRFMREDGTGAWLEMSVTPLREGGVVGALHDVTAMKHAEDELLKLSLVASATDNLVIITDREGRTEWVNDAFVRRTGYSLAEMSGRKPGHVLKGTGTDPQTVARVRQAQVEGRAVEAELLNYTRDGAPYWVRMNISPIRDATGRVQRFVSVQAETTQQRRFQHELEEAKERAEYLAEQAQASSKAKGEFLAIMSHEIRTPMNAVLGFASVLEDTPLDPKQREYLATIARSGESLLEIINEILDYSKLESGHFQIDPRPADIHRVVADAVALCQPPPLKPLRLGLSIHPDTPRTGVIDPVRLRQVLLNIVGNAVKFTASGRVDVRVGPEYVRPNGDCCLRFQVEDTGIGIAEENLGRLFQPFTQVDASTTRNYGGTGLGLAISKALVTLMGGMIGVESELGRGSTFTFTVNAAALALQTDGSPAPIVPLLRPLIFGVDERSLRILVVEDNSANLTLLLRLLADMGIRADSAADGYECLEAVRTNGYDLIFMDLRMPGMDGLETTRELRRIGVVGPRSARSYICALTANIMEQDREECFAAGVDLFLGKPIRVPELKSAIQQAANALRVEPDLVGR